MDALGQLQHLLRIDRDAWRAYSQAIDNADEEDLREMLTGFRADHERHIADLSAAIAAMGGTPAKLAHMAGFALARITGVAAGMNSTGALMAIQSNEVVTNQAYELALQTPLTAELRELLERNLADERRHLAAIRERLEGHSVAGHMLSRSATMQGLGTSLWMNVIRANPVATAMAATGAAVLLGGYFLGHRKKAG